MRVLPLLVALALAFGPPQTAFGGDNDAQMVQAFFDSDYTMCDAHFVSKTFEMDLHTAKAYIGQKISWGTTSILDGDLEKGRARGRADASWRCRFHMLPLTYADAEALAAYWGISVSEAKTRAEDKVHYGNEQYLVETVVVQAREALPEGSEQYVEVDATAANLEAFAKSSYDACHANMLVGTYFGESVAEVKDLIGYKAANGWTGPVDSMLDKARAQHRASGTKPCAFHQTPFTYDDAVLLAQVWKSDVAEAKARVESKYAAGSETVVKDALLQAKSTSTNPDEGSDEGPAMGKPRERKGRKRGR